MNYAELLQALLDLKESGKELEKMQVVYKTRRCNRREINRAKIAINSKDARIIELSE